MRFEQTQTGADERALIDAARRGEQAAFKKLYERHRDQVYNLIYYWLGDAVEAEDALQAVFIKVYRGLSGFRFESSFSTWVYRIATNECKNLARRRGVRSVPLEAVLGGVEELDPAPAQDDERARIQRETIIEQAISDLPEKLRVVVVLKYHEGLSYEEIASALGCAPGTVASRLNRALARLGARLKPMRKLL